MPEPPLPAHLPGFPSDDAPRSAPKPFSECLGNNKPGLQLTAPSAWAFAPRISARNGWAAAGAVISDPPYNVPIDGHVCGSGKINRRC